MSYLRFFLLSSMILTVMAFTLNPKQTPLKTSNFIRKSTPITQYDPPCMQMYFYIEEYADSFNIPKHIAYGVAHTETGYKGPFHWNYSPDKTSSSGAVGAMQVMVSTARGLNKDNISKHQLKTDIRYNIMTSMKLLRRLYNKHQNWKVVLGAYNTGRPCINGYSNKIFNHKLKW